MVSNERRPKGARVTDDCFAVVVRQFLASPKFAAYAPSTQDLWRRYLNFAAAPNCMGTISMDEIKPSIVQAYMDGHAGSTGVQAATLAALKQLERWAIVRDILPRPITTGVEVEASDGGHTPWSNEQVALAEQHARPDIARAITLGANTGQRGSDLIRMGWTDIETWKGADGINVTQQKTGRKIWVPITPALAAAMATWERKPGPILTRLDGHHWTRRDLTMAWTYQRDTNPALAPLAGLVLHGLRGHACVRLLRANANTRQISDMVGMSEPMVARYTRLSSQKENASAAVYHMRTTGERGVINIDKSNKSGGASD
jgi:integrase